MQGDLTTMAASESKMSSHLELVNHFETIRVDYSTHDQDTVPSEGARDTTVMSSADSSPKSKVLRQFETAYRRFQGESCNARIYIRTVARCKPCNFLGQMHQLSLWQVLDALHDAWTVSSSIVDIFTDILVAIAFYQQGHMAFFYSSLAIFVVAQVSYAFLFTGTWAANHSMGRQLCVFFAVLPFGQLIPVFAWLESFRFAAIDRCLKALDLTPTAKATKVPLASAGGSAAAATAPMRDDGGADNLWTFIQRKYTAHAGFLAEAFVEAIPQGILQLVAILTLDDTAAVNVFSILMSISVVASKGYLVAYSIHWPTFTFNYATIAADAFNLFATATWLFSSLNRDQSAFNGENGSKAANPLEDYPWLVVPFLLGLIASAVGGFALAIFTICDDHLKMCYPCLYSRILAPGEVVWFHVYFVRTLAWALAVVPASVVYATAKLSLLPVFVFSSLDPEHAIHVSFYRPLFQFLLSSLGSESTCTSKFLSDRDLLSMKPDLRLVDGSQGTGGVQGAEANRSTPTSSKCSACISALRRRMTFKLHGQAFVPHDGTNPFHTITVRQTNTSASQFLRRVRFDALDRQLRLATANRFLLEARNQRTVLEEALKSSHSRVHGTAMNANSITIADAALERTTIWVLALDTTESTLTRRDKRKIAEASAAKIEGINKQDDVAAQMRASLSTQAAAVRTEERQRAADQAIDRGAGHLQARSEILKHFMVELPSSNTGNNGEVHELSAQEWMARTLSGCFGILAQLRADAEMFCCPQDERWKKDRYRLPNSVFLSPSRRRRLHRCGAIKRLVLRFLGLSCLPVITVSVLIWVPATVLFAAYSAVFPLTQMGQCWRDNGDDSVRSRRLLLPCVLSYGYLACMVILICLAPLVLKFQQMRRALRDAKGFPKSFYRAATVGDIYRRYTANVDRLDLTRMLHSRVGHFNAIEIVSYLKESNRGAPYT